MSVRGVWASHHDSVWRCRSLRRTNYLQSKETIHNSQNLPRTTLCLVTSCYLRPPLRSLSRGWRRVLRDPGAPAAVTHLLHMAAGDDPERPAHSTFTPFPRDPDRDETLLHWGSNEPQRQKGKEPRASGAHCGHPTARPPMQGALGTPANAGRGQGAVPPGRRRAPTARAQTPARKP